MQNNRILRIAALLVCLAVLAFTGTVYYNREISQCMGLPLLNGEKMQQMQFTNQDLSSVILLDGYPAAIDKETNTIYVSQNIDEKTYYTDLKGVFSSADENILLYFAEDANLKNPQQSIKDGYTFALVAECADRSFTKYNVVFTTLPVINMGGIKLYENESGESVYGGNVTLWSSKSVENGAYTVHNNYCEWHGRGDSTAGKPKRPYKLSFKNNAGENENINLVGLGEDDDYILNTMIYDDLKLREKIVIELWNDIVKNYGYNYPMTKAEYVEVVLNEKYYGLCMLQRRIDNKYIGLTEDNIIYKGTKYDIDGRYITVGKTEDSEISRKIIDDFEQFIGVENLNLNSWIDTKIFIDLGDMSDNRGRNNMYYIIENYKDAPEIKFLLWDTDISFGINYMNGKFGYDFDRVNSDVVNRNEYEYIKEIYPEIDKMIYERWMTLRSSELELENLQQRIKECDYILYNSGAEQRDAEKWGKRNAPEDSVENLCAYMEKRIELLDEYYKIMAQ